MSVRGIGALERGDRRTPQRETLALLGDALELGDAERRTFEAAANPRGSRGPRRDNRVAGEPSAVPASNLPRSPNRFVGRATEMREIGALVLEHRLVTISGAGGIGKTRTALEVGAGLLETSPAGVWLVDLAPIAEPSRVAAAIAAGLAVPDAAAHSPLETLLAFLERRQMWLLLDNCDHVIDAVRSIGAAMMQRCRGVSIIATSREPLYIAGERQYRLAPLHIPPKDAQCDARGLLALDAPQLFVDRAVAADHRFTLTDDDAPYLADICRRLDGMPLALELAAARVVLFSMEELARCLVDPLRVLTNVDRSAQPRQRTIRALIDWSYDLLTERERVAFRALSIFAGGFSLESAAAVWNAAHSGPGAAVELLSSLVNKSLVHVEPAEHGTRYRLLESIRQYAHDRLDECGERPAIAMAHARALLASAESTEHRYATQSDREWHAQTRPERENWRAALSWSLEARGDVALGIALASSLRWVWVAQEEGRRWTRLALSLCDERTPDGVIAALHLSEAHGYAASSQYRRSRDEAERARSHLCASEVAKIAEADWRIGNAAAHLGDGREGEARLRAALAAYRALELPKMMCWVLICLALARSTGDDPADARTYLAEALAIAREHEFAYAATVAVGNLAEVEFRLGDAEAAMGFAAEALAGSRRAHNDVGSAYHLSNLTAYLLALGRYAEARANALTALDLTREIRVDVLTASFLQHLAAAAVLSWRPAAATPHDVGSCAAQVLGYVDARLSSLGAKREFTEAAGYRTLIDALDERFGAQKRASLMGEGSSWSEERARAEARLL